MNCCLLGTPASERCLKFLHLWTTTRCHLKCNDTSNKPTVYILRLRLKSIAPDTNQQCRFNMSRHMHACRLDIVETSARQMQISESDTLSSAALRLFVFCSISNWDSQSKLSMLLIGVQAPHCAFNWHSISVSAIDCIPGIGHFEFISSSIVSRISRWIAIHRAL